MGKEPPLELRKKWYAEGLSLRELPDRQIVDLYDYFFPPPIQTLPSGLIVRGGLPPAKLSYYALADLKEYRELKPSCAGSG